MTIDFGSIKSYNTNRGFGFVGRTFFNSNEKVFFHITKINKKYPELAQTLENRKSFYRINFWYEIETTEKGEQVSKLWLSARDIPQSHTHKLDNLIQEVEKIWRNINSPKPSWLDPVTIDLLGVDRRAKLNVERDNLESQRRIAEEERRRAEETERLRQIETQQEQIRIAQEVA